jgi:hypothetical protein
MSADHIYFNVEVSGDQDNTEGTLARYDETRSQPLIDRMSEYEVATARFYLPTQNIPILLWKENYWKVSLEYNGNTYSKTLTFVPNTNQSTFYGNSVWSYQYMIDRVNDAYTEAYNSLVSAEGVVAGITRAPYFTFDSKLELFTLIAEQAYDVKANPTTIKVQMNGFLYNYFSGFQVTDNSSAVSDPSKYRFVIKDNFNNVVGGNIELKQEYSTLSIWYDVKKIRFITNLPVTKEQLSTSGSSSENIIFDYNFDVESFQTALLYLPEGPRRWYSLESSDSLYNLTFDVYWIDRDDTKYRVYIPPFNTMTMKLYFRKRILFMLE